MKVKNRLAQLRPQSATQNTSREVPLTCAQRLQLLRPRSIVKPVKVQGIDTQALAECMAGRLLTPGLILVERRFDFQSYHGAYRLADLLATAAVLPEAQGYAPETLLFLDTETTGLAGGSGTLVFMLGLARLEGHALVSHQYLLSGFSDEQAMFRAIEPWLQEAQALVSFNGKSFDVPLLSTRARLAGADDHFVGLPHIDLLHPTRRAYGRRWPDCRLSTVERKLLHFTRTDDLPGAEAPQAWFDWIHYGRHARLPQVAEHNFWDLVTLVALLPLLGEVHQAPEKWQADVLAFARNHIKHQRHAQARQLLERCRGQLNEQGRLELAWLYRRSQNWQAARELWEPLADAGNHAAREWLAKYYEHVVKDLPQALKHAYALPQQDGHEQRRRRLQERLAKVG